MRISDWSSDVCSSDLQQLAGLHPREVAPARIHQEAPAVGRDGGAEVVADRLVPAELDGETEGRRQIDAQLGFAVLPGRPEGYAAVRAHLNLPSDTAEIGRASCRERLCQYV